ncbi:MAG TPA: molecular chaperone HtpG [Parachlamydiaceae bacterium]|nr:molecular chaperone HtpG [Parachlamydiaceae bacterium]
MAKKNLEIHSENILPIIKKWLYSDKDIFIRELISNACDAIQKAKILNDRKEIHTEGVDFRIDVKIDKEKKTLMISDNGIGMTEEEVQKYIAQIAFSGAEDFVHKYQSGDEQEQFIGHFGLGFYSAYMVASKVEIQTLSYLPNSSPVFWSCDGSSEYLIEKGDKTVPGTSIILFIDKDSEEFLEETKLNQMLHHYCSFLPYPVFLDDKRINKEEPLWIKAPSECKEEDYLSFYRHLFPMNEEPLFWVHLNVDYPFHLKGILYFPKMKKNYDLDKSHVQLYCNRVFVSDSCKDVIPNYLMALEGVIDSPDIPLNVSRSYLQMDKTVRQLSSHISKKVSDSLSVLYKNDHERFIKAWNDISFVIKLGVLEDEKFYERVKDFLIFKTTENSWTTLHDYLEKNREKLPEKVIYAKSDSHLSHIAEIYKEKNVEIILTDHPIDQYLIQFLERKLAPVKFQRIDASVDDHLLDKDKEVEEATSLAEFISKKLPIENVEVVAKSLSSNAIPGFIMIDEGTRRMRDYMMQMQGDVKEIPAFGKNTFVVNTNSPLIQAIKKLDEKNPELAKDLVLQAYELSLLSQHEMRPNLLNEFILRSNRVLSTLAEEITK